MRNVISSCFCVDSIDKLCTYQLYEMFFFCFFGVLGLLSGLVLMYFCSLVKKIFCLLQDEQNISLI